MLVGAKPRGHSARMAAPMGVILAGGQSRRMGGGDKCLLPLGGRAILDHVIATAKPQVAALALNANGDPARFRPFGLPVLPDPVGGFPGPLAGILAAMDWAASQGGQSVVSFTADAPFLPHDLVARLQAGRAAAEADMAIAKSGGQIQPLMGLWPVALRQDLHHAVAVEGLRRVREWIARYRCAEVEFAAGDRDPFFNINEAADLAAAEAGLASARAARG